MSPLFFFLVKTIRCDVVCLSRSLARLYPHAADRSRYAVRYVPSTLGDGAVCTPSCHGLSRGNIVEENQRGRNIVVPRRRDASRWRCCVHLSLTARQRNPRSTVEGCQILVGGILRFFPLSFSPQRAAARDLDPFGKLRICRHMPVFPGCGLALGRLVSVPYSVPCPAYHL